MSAIYAVILSDVVRSRRESGFRETRDTTLNRLTAGHLAKGWIEAPYAVTAWDEFQVLTHEIPAVPRLIWSLVTSFYPLQLRIGVGIGRIEADLDTDAPLNETATGEAFIRARDALNSVKKGKDQKYDPSSHADTGNRSVDLFMNTSLHLLDTLIARATPSQWEVILDYERLGRQDRVAENLEKAESTVSRALKRSYYWQIIEAIEAMEEFLQIHFLAHQDAKPGNCT